MNSNRDSNRDTGRALGALVLIGLGVLFLAGQVFDMNIWGFFGGLFSFDWPFYIILPGVALLAVALVGSERVAPLAIPGAVVTGTGVILLFQERFDYYESWAYVWALYPVFVGLALMFVGARTRNHTQVEAGRRVTMIGLGLFAVFGAFMELIFNDRFDFIGRYLVPVVLIGGGAFLLLRGRSSTAVLNGPGSSKRKREDNRMFVDDSNGKRKYAWPPASVTPSLQRQIDAAIAEDGPDDPNNGNAV